MSPTDPYRQVRVFISSTFRDMQAERDWLVRFVFPKLREELVKYRIHFVDVDLRWGVTGKEDAGEVCREVIGECHPRFLCILGGRYGWVPPPKRIAADEFAKLRSGASAAGVLTETEMKDLLALYTLTESGGEFRLQKKPDAKDAREIYGAQCKVAVLALRRARLALSITADEIDFGVLNPPSNDHGPVRAFFFFRHEAATNRMVEEKAGDFCEPTGSDNARALAELKTAIAAAGHAPRIYGEHAGWNATAKRLVDLEEFGEDVLADLRQSIKDDPKLAERFSPEAEAARNETSDQKTFADEADAMDAFIEERTERFVLGSRQSLLDDLLAFATADGAQNILVLTGDPGSGKSALLAQFVRSSAFRRFPAPPEGGTPNSPLIIPHFIGASSGSTDLRRTLRRLCHALAPTEPLPQDLKELIAHFHALLTGTKQRVILVLDALNQLDHTDGAHWLNWLPPVGKLPPHVRIIASVIAPAEGENEHQTLAILRNRKDAGIRNLQALSWRDTVRIMRGYLRRFSKRLAKSQKRALLDKPAGRLPLYILTALEELRTLGTDEQLVALASQPLFPPEELERLRREEHDAILTKFIATELPGTAVELFRWILETRLSKEPILATHPHAGAAGLVENFAACLGVSRHGLSPAELTALLDPGDPLGNVAALLRLLRPYLMRRGELLDFYHTQFREAAGAAYLDTPEKQRVAHLKLADFFEKSSEGRSEVTPRAAAEWPYQLRAAEAWDNLEMSLTNIPLFLTLSGQDFQLELMSYWGALCERGVNIGASYQMAYDEWLTRGGRSEDHAVCQQIAMFLTGFDYGEMAKPLAARAYALKRKLLGIEHPATLESQVCLAAIAQRSFAFSESETLLREVLVIRERTLGPDDPATLACANELGITLLGRDKQRAARRLHEATLAKRQRVLGPEHDDTVQSMVNLALVLTHMGDWKEAVHLNREALRIRELTKGLTHPKTILVVCNIMDLMMKQGDFAAAEMLSHRVIASTKHLLGGEHPMLFQLILGKVGLLVMSKRRPEAQSLCREAIEGLLRVSLSEKRRADILVQAISALFLTFETGTPPALKLAYLRQIGEPLGKADYLIGLGPKTTEARMMGALGLGCFGYAAVLILVWWRLGFLRAVLVVFGLSLLLPLISYIRSKNVRHLTRIMWQRSNR